MNGRIRAPEVRVIDDAGEPLGVLPTEQALEIARDRGLDLVEVAPTAQPPVTRILDYGKFKYEQAKKESEGRKKQSRVVLREVKMKPNIGQHDMDFKLRTAAKLLRAGDKVKLTVVFRGREITHPEIGRGRIRTMMERLEAEESLPLTVEKDVGMEGRFMSVIVAEDKVRAAALLREQADEAEATG
ncbi:MAG: translation initiation factor IF-3 [Chloroflexota bacterium]|nr:translation initiation factor IF-3 [Chloroflexota bacterium]